MDAKNPLILKLADEMIANEPQHVTPAHKDAVCAAIAKACQDFLYSEINEKRKAMVVEAIRLGKPMPSWP